MKFSILSFFVLCMSAVSYAAPKTVSFSVQEIKPTCMQSQVQEIIRSQDLDAAETCFKEVRRESNIKSASLSAKGAETVSGYINGEVPVEGTFDAEKVIVSYWFGIQSEVYREPTETYGIGTVKVDGELERRFLVKLTFCDEDGCENNAGFLRVAIN